MKAPVRKSDIFEIERISTEEPEVRSLMLDLEDWFNLIVKLENILNWKCPRSTLLVLSSITTLFLLIHVYEPPVLLVIGCSGLLLSVVDYFGPLVLSRIFIKPPNYEDNWCYWNFCRRLVHIRHVLINFFIFVHRVRHRNSVLHFFTSSSLLFIVGFVGLHMSDLLLFYLLILMCFVAPKLHPKGILTVIGFSLWCPIAFLRSCIKKLQPQMSKLFAWTRSRGLSRKSK
ncbi:unnamed protein product [Heterobilharzia americana]|nr:unnamed protein product [Heterobilharzia americana]CAH8664227.1 unnamed protein product [Heterobilharzia americana]